MADYGRVLAAVDQVLGTEGLETYRGMGRRIAEDVLEGDHDGTTVQELLADRRQGFTGTMTELLASLDARREAKKRPPSDWPRSPRALRGALNRVTPALRQLGYTVEFSKVQDRRQVTLRAPGKGA